MPEPMSPLDEVRREGFGRWLAVERESFGLSRRELGEKVGVSGEWLRQLEVGDFGPTRDLAARIGKALDDDPDMTLARAGYLPYDLVNLLSEKPKLVRAILEILGLPRKAAMPDFTKVKEIANRLRPDLSQGDLI